jgi:hypothetical protein
LQTRVPTEELVAPLVGDNGFQREIVRVGVSLKRLGVHGQQILCCRGADAILRTARTAINVPVFDSPDESQALGDSSDALGQTGVSSRIIPAFRPFCASAWAIDPADL